MAGFEIMPKNAPSSTSDATPSLSDFVLTDDGTGLLLFTMDSISLILQDLAAPVATLPEEAEDNPLHDGQPEDLPAAAAQGAEVVLGLEGVPPGTIPPNVIPPQFGPAQVTLPVAAEGHSIGASHE